MSSMLDDTMFVVRQAATRALSTASMRCFSMTVSVAVEQLRSVFKEALSRTLSGCTASIVAAFKGGAAPDAATVEAAAAPLNNVVLSTAYVAQMHEALESQAVHKCALLPCYSIAAYPSRLAVSEHASSHGIKRARLQVYCSIRCRGHAECVGQPSAGRRCAPGALYALLRGPCRQHHPATTSEAHVFVAECQLQPVRVRVLCHGGAVFSFACCEL